MATQAHAGIGRYFLVFAALMGLFALTVVGHFLHWGLAAALLIALAKAILVAYFFMHLNLSSRLIQCAACAGLLWLSALICMTVTDAATRPWFPSTVNPLTNTPNLRR